MHNHFHAHSADTDGCLVDKRGTDAHTRTQTTMCQQTTTSLVVAWPHKWR